jgi:hypothetical protein
MIKSYEYDVALSFAGEDRNYVRAVADLLTSQKVKVFFDEYELVDMWGKDLYDHLHKVYSSRAKYCVIFVSEAYSRKIWTTHERKSAQERALREHYEYILPARFDNTELPGLRSTTGYIDLRNLTPDEMSKIIIEKLGRSIIEVTAVQEPGYRLPRQRPNQFNPYNEAERFISFFGGKMQERASALQNTGSSLSVFKRGAKTCIRLVRAGRTLFSLDIWTGGMSGDKGLSFYAIDGEIMMSSDAINAWAEIVWDQEKEEIILKLNDFSLFSRLPSQELYVTFDEFVERIWERIVGIIDQDGN